MTDEPDRVACMLRRSPDTAAEISRILGLRDLYWTEALVTFGVDQTATAQVTLIISRQQLLALVEASTAMGGPRQ